jgi:hypothetical protein
MILTLKYLKTKPSVPLATDTDGFKKTSQIYEEKNCPCGHRMAILSINRISLS